MPGGRGIDADGRCHLEQRDGARGRRAWPVLLRTYLHTLGEVTPRPDAIIFFNSGVMLAAKGSQALDDLRALANQGVHILLCGTCVGHFGLKERLAIGEISNMYAISEMMLHAGKVVNI